MRGKLVRLKLVVKNLDKKSGGQLKLIFINKKLNFLYILCGLNLKHRSY